MRSPEEFEEFLEGTLLPELRALRAEREEILARRCASRLPKQQKVAIAVSGLVLAVALDQPLLAWVGFVLPFFVDLVRASRHPLPKRKDAKHTLVRRVIEFFDESFCYEPRGVVPERLLAESELWGEGYDRYLGEDRVEGKHGATAFRFSEIRLVRDEPKNRSETLFSGLFFVADFNKEFRGRTVVLPDRTERHLGMLGRALQRLPFHGRGELVQLESPAFERLFKVYASDETEARYILSPGLMQRIARFRENSGAPLRISFVDGRLHLLLPLAHDPFAVRRLEEVDAAAIRAWVGDLHFALGIVEELDLNTRIWTKGPSAKGAARGWTSSEEELLPAEPGFFAKAFRGGAPLWQVYVVFMLGGGLLVGHLMAAAHAAAAVSTGSAAVLQLFYFGPASLVLWTNARNARRRLWCVLARLQALAIPLGLLTTALANAPT